MGDDEYIPALGHKWLTPLYDPMLKWLLQEETFKRVIVNQLQTQGHARVLDVGCGTGTLTLMIKRRYPDAKVVGLDGDPAVLAIARNKARQARAAIQFDAGLAHRLPYPDGSFDQAVSSLMFHHLNTANKREAAREIWRVLKPGGQLILADIGKPHNPLAAIPAMLFGRLEQAGDNVAGRIPHILSEAGFAAVEPVADFLILMGTLSVLRTLK